MTEHSTFLLALAAVKRDYCAKRVRHSTKITEAVSRKRLNDYKRTAGKGPHFASTLAKIIWPDIKFSAKQGAGAAAASVLRRNGCQKLGKGQWKI